MSKKPLGKMKFIRTLFSNLKDERGVSAIEFAIIFPLLISLYFGVAELTQALIVDRKVTQISSSVADLVAQEKTVSANSMNDIFLAANQIITPYDVGNLNITISSVVTDGSNNTTVEWSSASSGSGHSAGSSFALPAGIAEANAGVIVAEVSYNYTSALGKYILGSIELDDQFILKPRNSAKVEWQ